MHSTGSPVAQICCTSQALSVQLLKISLSLTVLLFLVSDGLSLADTLTLDLVAVLVSAAVEFHTPCMFEMLSLSFSLEYPASFLELQSVSPFWYNPTREPFLKLFLEPDVVTEHCALTAHNYIITLCSHHA